MTQRIFVTGASGYLGGAIAARLARGGAEVHGLTRSPKGATALERAGIRPVVGDLADADSFLGALKNCDAAVHAAVDNNAWAERDQQALEAFRAAAQDGRLRRLLYTSGVWVLGDTGGAVADETTSLDPAELVRWRVAHEEVALDLVDDEVAVIVLRPALVYGEHRGILSGLFAEARAQQIVTIPGDGTQHWALVHRDDVAEAYRLALEHGKGGDRYLLADDSRHTVREIGEAVARVTGATLKRKPAATVRKELGAYGKALLLDQQVSAGKARRELGWVARHASFVGESEAVYGEWQAGQKTAVA